MRVAVLGAGGAVGASLVADIAACPQIDGLTLLDRSGEQARAVAAQHGRGIAHAAAVDAGDPQGLYLALEGHQLLVNVAGHHTNASAMDACVAADCSYVDLGGLDHDAGDEPGLNEPFADRGLLAVLGCGASPGITNLMAARAARDMTRIDTVRCAFAAHEPDPTAERPGAHPHGPSLTWIAVVADGGRFALPAFPAVMSAPRDGCALHVRVTGHRDDSPVSETVTAFTAANPGAGCGGAVRATASMAAVTARLFASGALRAAGFGVHPPEVALSSELALGQLEDRGITFTITSDMQEVRVP